jgi:anthranilate phosphoribosyltransferase
MPKQYVKLAALNGLSALDGAQGSTYDALVYAGAIALLHLHKHDTLQNTAAQIRDVLDNRQALSHFESAKD